MQKVMKNIEHVDNTSDDHQLYSINVEGGVVVFGFAIHWSFPEIDVAMYNGITIVVSDATLRSLNDSQFMMGSLIDDDPVHNCMIQGGESLSFFVRFLEENGYEFATIGPN